MKKLLIVFSILFSLQCANAQSPDERIANLVGGTDRLALNREFALVKDSINPVLYHLSETLLHHAFNRPEEAVKSVDYLIENFQDQLGYDNSLAMLFMGYHDLLKMGEYQVLYERTSKMLNNPDLTNSASQDLILGLEKYNLQAKCLKTYPKSSIERTNNLPCEVILHKDSYGLSQIACKVNGKSTSMIFDTGADIPAMISLDFAKKHGVEIFKDSILTAGWIASEKTNIGFIDSINVGNIVYKNLYCIITPRAEIMHEDSVVGRMDAVLGRPFMDKVGEFHLIPKENKIVFPVNQSELSSFGVNMMLMAGQPYVEGRNDNERLLFHIDMGLKSDVELGFSYFNKHRVEIENACKMDSIGIGGIGGAKRILAYKLPEFSLTVADVEVTNLRNIDVWTEQSNINHADGTIGIDYIDRFDKVIFNFSQMFFKVEND